MSYQVIINDFLSILAYEIIGHLRPLIFDLTWLIFDAIDKVTSFANTFYYDSLFSSWTDDFVDSHLTNS